MVKESRDRILGALQSLLDDSIASGVPGISAAVQTREGQRDLVAGCSDLSIRESIRKNTSFGIGSITKIFIAVVILQLVQENKLDLIDRASSFLDSEILEGIPHANEASIADLLSHSAGIPSWEDDPTWIQDGRGRNIQPNKKWMKQETLRYVQGRDVPTFAPGRYHYANTNYTILGLIIEKVTHDTAEAQVRHRILQPLHMDSTYFEGFEEPRSSTPSRYHWATDNFRRTAGISSSHIEVRPDLVDVTGTNLSVSWTAGGMISNTSDLLKLATALQNGSILDAMRMQVLMDWHEADQGKDMGHGIFRLKTMGDEHGYTWVGHNGGVLGFTGALWWTTDGSCAVAILSNVGGSHAAPVPSSAAHVALATPFLQLAAEYAAI